MKKHLLLSLLFAAVLGTASAQKVIVKTYIEKTQMSVKTGTAIGFENRYLWEYGAFFQEASLMESLMSAEKIESLPYQYEREFAGVYFAVPVLIREQLVLKANVRTGLSNNENFVITPSILVDYKPMKHLQIGMGVGSRAFRPTLQASVSFAF